MHTDLTHTAICAEYATRPPGPPAGPCVLRPQHQGRIHQDVRGNQWSTPAPAPAAGGVLEDALAVVGETGTGCFIPPRTPAGQRTRPGSPDSRGQDAADTALSRADTVRAAINHAFDIHAETAVAQAARLAAGYLARALDAEAAIERVRQLQDQADGGVLGPTWAGLDLALAPAAGAPPTAVLHPERHPDAETVRVFRWR